MIATKLSRAAPRATAAFTSSSATSATSSAQQATRCLATGRPSHQRRRSSSKASPPPDSAANGKPAPAGKAQAQAQAQAQAKGEGDSPVPAERKLPAERKRTGHRRAGEVQRAGKRKEGVDQFAGLPSVPSLPRMNEVEVQSNLSIASFFSLHRPISLTTPVPPIVTEQTFSSIFSARDQQDPWHDGNSAERRPEDIVITLTNTIEMLEGHQNHSESEGVRWEVLSESPSNAAEGGVRHLDGAPQPRMKSLDELVANFRPFKAPPPPEPFDEKYARPLSTTVQKQATTSTVKKGRKPKQKIYVTEIRVTESTHSDGRKTYAASSTPIRRLEESQTSQPPSASRQLFLERMRRRSERAVRDEMGRIRAPMWVRKVVGMGHRRSEVWRCISVKRQRKLKMKKHKHKKLMKRTRNLRRRLGRT